MPASEFREWVAYNRLNPIGELRGDIRIAAGFCALYNATRPRRAQALKVKHFMLDFRRERKQTAEQQWAILSVYAALHNRKVARDGENNR